MRKLLLLLLPCLCAHALVIARLRGQLGNQMFQVAAAVALAQENHCKVCFPDFGRDIDWGETRIDKNFGTLFHRIPNRLSSPNLHPSSYYIQKDGGAYEPIPYRPYREIIGYFQSEKFFKKYETLIRKIYKMPPEIEQTLQKRYSDLLAHPKTVGLHVRTGYEDYLRTHHDPKFYAAFLPPDLNFYTQAIDKFDADSLFIVCSDHIGWCKKHFQQIPRNFIFIESDDYFLDLYLLTLCKDIIIANSTFGWWAAYLNENPHKRVICRNPFVGFIAFHSPPDILCDTWEKIDMPSTSPPLPIYE
ncbi:MAG TPA: alpha-1,2-fucosyltransferase [Chlamydiales bacterium]|nr:alpha-1,2-fucosyltransferase [Chlamydiales bacterium]